MMHFVYLISNQINGKMYIGKTINPIFRWATHKKIAFGGKDKYPLDFFVIHAAIKKYGANNFIFQVIDEFDNELEAYTAETQWILLLCSNLKKYGYNCNIGGRGGVQPTEESKQRMIDAQNTPKRLRELSEAMLQRHKENPGFLSNVHKGNQYTKGIKLTKEHRRKISNTLKDRKFSEEHLEKIKHALPRGECVKSSKLTERQVIDIRSKYIPHKYGYTKLGKEYGVNDETIRAIISRRTWKHI